MRPTDAASSAALISRMRLSTYQSTPRPTLFVTVATVEARSVIAMVDELATLDLHVVRENYEASDAPRDASFRDLVSARIAEVGYAMHGFERAVGRRTARHHHPRPSAT